ncbi:MAG: N-6 DNA methylase [Woeseiaceae bacterium]
MKKSYKKLVTLFISNLNQKEKTLSIGNISTFFAVLIAALTLKQRASLKTDYSINGDICDPFLHELDLIKSRFPDLVSSYNSVVNRLRKQLVRQTIQDMLDAYDEQDENVDDIISWTYQFLKRDLEKSAFSNVGKNNFKLQNLDILYTTQFFTDRYMVKYLVNKALNNINKSELSDVVVIDPASGGGNFLTYSFDKLFGLHKKFYPSLSNRGIVDKLLTSMLIGFDLDSNLSKIASLSLYIKACSYAVPSSEVPVKIFGGVAGDLFGSLSDNCLSNSICGNSYAAEIEDAVICSKKKIYVTNPPFMGKRDMDVNLKGYLITRYPESKGDLCVSFLQNIIQSMSEYDVLGVVAQNNWMHLSSLKEFRRYFLENVSLQECVDLGTKAFENINGEKTNVALYVIKKLNAKPTSFYNLKHENIDSKINLLSKSNIPIKYTYQIEQSDFKDNPGYEFSYYLTSKFTDLHTFLIYSDFATPMQGTSTGNNSEFVKYAWEVNGDKNWRLVSKGGGFSKWMGLNYFKVFWGNDAEYIKKNKGSALRNINKISATQLVYSDTGTLGMNVRILKKDQVFIASGPGILVNKGDVYAHIAYLNSRVATFFLKLINPKFTISAGYIGKLPVAKNILNSSKISKSSEECIRLKDEYLQRKLPNIEYKHCDYLKIKNLDSFLEAEITKDIQNDFERLFLENKIEKEIIAKFKFNDMELNSLQEVVGKSRFLCRRTKINCAIEVLDDFICESLDTNCTTKSKKINGYTFGSDNSLEQLSYKLNANPKAVVEIIIKNVANLKGTKKKYFMDLLHKILLKELGIQDITSYKNNTKNMQRLTNKIRKKYVFLSDYSELYIVFRKIIEQHHKQSFFNAPLVKLYKDSVVVGHAANE